MTGIYLCMHGGAWVAVSATPRSITTYVLLEQEDWFEKEIRFLRRWLKPGMHVVDIGANHGVYALALAKLLGPTGILYAYEPAKKTFAMLERSIEKNAMANVRPAALALSSHEGTGALFTYELPELNSFTRSHAAGEMIETVAISTIDSQAEVLAWDKIDLIKIDTEGEELRVVGGGRSFFARESPLVMFEIPGSRKAYDIAAILHPLRSLGYTAYRLIGPDSLLVPFRENEPIDQYELNLFACKEDRADALAGSGFLVRGGELRSPAVLPSVGGFVFADQIYAGDFAGATLTDTRYQAALDAYARWRNADSPLADRYIALTQALALVQESARNRPTLARLSSLARIALEAGARTVAVHAIDMLLEQMLRHEERVDEPFLPPIARYDRVSPQPHSRTWLLAAAFEAGELNRCHSGFWETPSPTISDLYEWFCATPYVRPEMERRRQLLRVSRGKQTQLIATPILADPGPENLNCQFWRSQ